MCLLCCSHTQLQLPHTPPCDPHHLYHVAHFAVAAATLFPGDRSSIDVYAANSLRLMAELRTTGLRPLLHTEPRWPAATLLSRVIAVSAQPDTPYGAIVAFPKQGPSMTGYDSFFRFRVVVVGRYKLARPSTLHCSYPCILVSLICEEPSIRLPCPDRVFPFLSPSPLRRSARSRIITRSAAAALRSAPRLRSSTEMGGLRYAHWRSVQPEVLVARACAAAAEHVHKFRPLVTDDVPNDTCPSRWSFWLCHCLSLSTPQQVLYRLHSETSVVRRLRTFIEFVRHGEQKLPVEQRVRAALARKPTTIRKPITKRRNKQAAASTALTNTSLKPSSHLHDILGSDPWPSSPAKGFQNVNLSLPCTGRFRPIPPEFCEPPTDKPVSHNQHGAPRKCIIRLQSTPPNCADTNAKPSNSSTTQTNACSRRTTS